MMFAETCPKCKVNLQQLELTFFDILTGLFRMVRNYKRKTIRKAVRQDVLDQAKVDLQQGDSIRSVAARFGMDESTLRKRLKKVFYILL